MYVSYIHVCICTGPILAWVSENSLLSAFAEPHLVTLDLFILYLFTFLFSLPLIQELTYGTLSYFIHLLFSHALNVIIIIV